MDKFPRSMEVRVRISESCSKSLAVKDAARLSGAKRKNINIPNNECLVCNKKFFSYSVQGSRKFCSMLCFGKSGLAGGYRQGSGHKNIKRGYYKGIWCASSWELAWLLYSQYNNLAVERNTDAFEYVGSDGQYHNYTPDFKVEDTYIEIKGRHYGDVLIKITQFVYLRSMERNPMSSPTYKAIKPQTNTIFRGDNLAIMRALPSNFVDLIYIDPPFFTQQNYRNIWGDKESVIDFKENFFEGFEDTKDFFERHIQSDAKGLKAYLEWMRARLVETHRILKPTGSFYLHLDHHAVHYVKVMLDEIFGYSNFRNEIIWRRSNPKGLTSKSYATNSDTILYYTKSNEYTWNPLFQPLDEKYVEDFYRHTEEKTGRRYRLGPLTNPSNNRPNLTYEWNGHTKVWRWTKERMKAAEKAGIIEYSSSGLAQQKQYLDASKGRPIDNIWTDIKQVSATEKTGWPTQKPAALLERIIQSSSKEGDLVFDCFAGCGTTMHVAHSLQRKWIGIDISPTAIKVNKDRLIKHKAKVNVVDEHDLPVVMEEKGIRQKSKKAA